MTESPGNTGNSQHVREVAASNCRGAFLQACSGLQAVWDFRKMPDAFIWTEDSDQPKVLQGAFPMFFYESTVYLSQCGVGCWELCSCQPMPLFVPLPAKLIYSESLDTW